MPDGGADDLDKEIMQRMMQRVLEAEQEKLYMRVPQGINNDIKAIIEDEVE